MILYALVGALMGLGVASASPKGSLTRRLPFVYLIIFPLVWPLFVGWYLETLFRRNEK